VSKKEMPKTHGVNFPPLPLITISTPLKKQLEGITECGGGCKKQSSLEVLFQIDQQLRSQTTRPLSHYSEGEEEDNKEIIPKGDIVLQSDEEEEEEVNLREKLVMVYRYPPGCIFP